MSNLATVQSMYAAFGSGDVPAIIERLAEDVEWEHDAIDHGVPWMKPGRGRAHVLSFFGVVGKELEFSRFEPGPLFEQGNMVIAVIHVEAKVRSTGKAIRDYELHVWTFDGRGKVSRFRHVVDTHQHLLASR